MAKEPIWKQLQDGYKEVGEIAVDAGLILLVGPEYKDDHNWIQAGIGAEGKMKGRTLSLPIGIQERGALIVETGADGSYPVYALYDKHGFLMEIRIPITAEADDPRRRFPARGS